MLLAHCNAGYQGGGVEHVGLPVRHALDRGWRRDGRHHVSSVPYKGEAGWSGLQEFKRDYHLPFLKCVSIHHEFRVSKKITKKICQQISIM